MKELKTYGCFAHKVAERFSSGFPDLIVINKKGKVMFIEVKVGKNKLTKLQEHFLDSIDGQGGHTYLMTQSMPEHIEVVEWDGLKITYTYDEWLQKNIR